MNTQEIRELFTRYFEQLGHRAVASGSLVPVGDASLFFANAGMVQFKNVFTGEEVRDYRRAVTIQKCMRVSGKHNDLENVGFTARHHTLFEMMGNFSFGDYFKQEAISFAWELLTEGYRLPKERLFVTVFRDDDEAYELWRAQGVPASHLTRCDEKDNFWAMGDTGPCGPCSEIYWDLEEGFIPSGEPDPWGRGHDADRYLEIWNLVFMQFERSTSGVLSPLPRPSIDTGMGLERLAAVLQGKRSNWDTDEFQSLIGLESALCGIPYGASPETDASLKVIADHARAAAFLIADGILPSNEGRGYVLRRVMRRAIRHGVKLGLEKPFLHHVSQKVVDLMGGAYPELSDRRSFIEKAVTAEERTFRETMTRGLILLEETFHREEEAGSRQLPGREVFLLHDTYGFPPDLTEVIAREKGFTIDQEGYDEAMKAQRQRGRDAWKGSGEEGLKGSQAALQRSGIHTEFLGYASTRGNGTVLRLLKEGEDRSAATQGDEVEVVMDRTPFYAESGGQVGDTGELAGAWGRARVLETRKGGSAAILHRVMVEEGTLQPGDEVEARVDSERRADIMRNHTATHLLHAALRELLGTHVQQKGSLVAPDRLRFDFSHFEPLTRQQIAILEEQVNQQIRHATHTRVEEMPYAEALKAGAMALFGEKYGDVVRVVQIPGFSTELCGGTHCASTGQIGLFKIAAESGVAAGVRRIEAMTGRGAMALFGELVEGRKEIASLMKAPEEELTHRIEKLMEERKALQRQVEELRQQVLLGGSDGSRSQVQEVNGVRVLAQEMEGVDAKGLKSLGDQLLERLGRGVVILGLREGDKATLVVKVSADLTDRIHAGHLVNALAALVGGKGGGRPDMAQAGGQSPQGLAAALAYGPKWVGEALAASSPPPSP